MRCDRHVQHVLRMCCVSVGVHVANMITIITATLGKRDGQNFFADIWAGIQRDAKDLIYRHQHVETLNTMSKHVNKHTNTNTLHKT